MIALVGANASCRTGNKGRVLTGNYFKQNFIQVIRNLFDTMKTDERLKSIENLDLASENHTIHRSSTTCGQVLFLTPAFFIFCCMLMTFSDNFELRTNS